MSALSPSPTAHVIDHLAAVTEDAGDDAPALLAVLAKVTDRGTGGVCATAGGDLEPGGVRGAGRGTVVCRDRRMGRRR